MIRAAEQALHADQGAQRALGTRTGITPQAELQGAGRHHLHRDQVQPGDRGGGPVGAGPGEPAVQLPAHPVGDTAGGQWLGAASDVGQAFPGRGFRPDLQPGAGEGGG